MNTPTHAAAEQDLGTGVAGELIPAPISINRWAQENDVSLKAARNMFNIGTLPVFAYRLPGGRVMVLPGCAPNSDDLDAVRNGATIRSAVDWVTMLARMYGEISGMRNALHKPIGVELQQVADQLSMGVLDQVSMNSVVQSLVERGAQRMAEKIDEEQRLKKIEEGVASLKWRAEDAEARCKYLEAENTRLQEKAEKRLRLV